MSRFENSLGLLTQRFLEVIQSSDGGTVDLNTAASLLGVAKRRIYDITNVLEGVGLIRKKSKNVIAWAGKQGPTQELQNTLRRRRDSIASLRQRELQIDQYLALMSHLQRKVIDDTAPFCFVTSDDVRSLACFPAETVVAIRAPSHSTLSVPDPDEGTWVCCAAETPTHTHTLLPLVCARSYN